MRRGRLAAPTFASSLLLSGHLDLGDRDRVVLGRAGNRHFVPGVSLEASEVLIIDLVNLVAVADEHVFLATLNAPLDAFTIGHLLRSVLAVGVLGIAHRIADPALH